MHAGTIPPVMQNVTRAMASCCSAGYYQRSTTMNSRQAELRGEGRALLARPARTLCPRVTIVG